MGRSTSPSSQAFFSEGFVATPSEAHFFSLEIGESEPMYGEDAVFSSMTTKHAPRVNWPQPQAPVRLDVNGDATDTCCILQQ
jgi:hypothetical protein